MPKIERSGPRTLVGEEYFDIVELGAISVCPDSDDASTPATQVHVKIQCKDAIGRKLPPFIARFRGTEMLDAFIEAMIENRTFVFGRRNWYQVYPEQKR